MWSFLSIADHTVRVYFFSVPHRKFRGTGLFFRTGTTHIGVSDFKEAFRAIYFLCIKILLIVSVF